MQHAQHLALGLVLKVIVDRGALALGDAFLFAIHLGDLAGRGGHVGRLVLADADEAREAQADALVARGVDGLGAGGLVAWAQGQVGGLDLPDVARLEPDVGLMLAARQVRVEGLGPLNDDRAELLV
jgi:hypothetical protein